MENRTEWKSTLLMKTKELQDTSEKDIKKQGAI